MDTPLVADYLRMRGVSRRGFLKFCASTASLMALPPMMIPRIARALENARRPSVIWLPFQECTGCTESITRAHGSTIEQLIFEAISLDYQHTLMAAAGQQSDDALHEAMKQNHGKYLLAVDGSIPLGNPGLLDHQRHEQYRHAQGSCRGCDGHRRDWQLRRVRRHSPGQSKSHRRRLRLATSSRTNRSSTSPAARRFRSSSPACWRRS